MKFLRGRSWLLERLITIYGTLNTIYWVFEHLVHSNVITRDWKFTDIINLSGKHYTHVHIVYTELIKYQY